MSPSFIRHVWKRNFYK